MSPGYPFNIRSKVQRSRARSQAHGHKVKKNMRSSGRRELCTMHSIECSGLPDHNMHDLSIAGKSYENRMQLARAAFPI